MRNNAHVSEHGIKSMEFLVRNSFDVVQQGSLEDELVILEIPHFLLAFFQESFVWTTRFRYIVLDPGIVEGLSGAHSFAWVELKDVFNESSQMAASRMNVNWKLIISLEKLFFSVWDFLGQQLEQNNTDAEDIRSVRKSLLESLWRSIDRVSCFLKWLAILNLDLKVRRVDKN